ncbi:MAG: hypothetical protein ACRC0J_07490, partial [Shewanella oncorhynchi]
MTDSEEEIRYRRLYEAAENLTKSSRNDSMDSREFLYGFGGQWGYLDAHYRADACQESQNKNKPRVQTNKIHSVVTKII